MHRGGGSRRDVLAAAGGIAAAAALPHLGQGAPSRPGRERIEAAVRELLGPGPIEPGRVVVDIPSLVENGNAVPMTVAVDSPMSEADHVRAIHVFNEKNPQAFVASFYLGPRAGKATVSTRIRLAEAQSVFVVCQMSDGSRWSGGKHVVVTIAACVDGD